MKCFGLIGYPLAQSFSKKYFDEKFKREGLADCTFENFPISTIQELKTGVLQQHPELKGLAVTIPYKQLVLNYLSSVKNIPEGLRACNCIKIVNGELIGYNTDYIGFEKSFSPLLQKHHNKALVLGNGGAASAIVFVLKKLNIEFDIVSRVLHQGSTLTYDELTENVISDHPIIINTTPLGMVPKIMECPPINFSYISHKHFLYDLVYNPAKTLFLQRGEERGALIKNGADMLELQAEENWKIWNS